MGNALDHVSNETGSSSVYKNISHLNGINVKDKWYNFLRSNENNHLSNDKDIVRLSNSVNENYKNDNISDGGK